MTVAPPETPTARRFRPEIEGLRALAALLVAAYHIWFGRVSGGVDVFFVIAGFMVTTTLLGHLERTGRIDAGRYLGRLMTRLLPNALVVLTVVALATWWLIPRTRHDEVYSEIAASALYYENWELAARSVDYLERGYTSSPVQHFWAMSIQGQFSLVWLVLFLLVVRLAPGAAHTRIALAMGLLVAGSFVFSVGYTAVEQPVAYFHTGTRVWEFGVGGLLALAAQRWPGWAASPRLSYAMGWAGLLAIVTCGAVLSVGTSFPGWIALWPVGGAALILLAGDHPSRSSASAVLSSPPLVRLGAVSYALYLWHWPLLVFVLAWTERDAVGPLAGLAIIGAAIVLSFVSTRLVERPVRSLRLDRRRAWSMPLLAAVVVVPLAATSSAIAVVSGSQTHTVATGLDPDRYPGALAMSPDAAWMTSTSENTAQPAPGVAAAPEDIPEVYDAGCHQEQKVDDVAVCEYGDLEAERTMLLTGGSHSAHWQPALQLVAEHRGWRLLSATKSGCRPGTHLVPVDSTDASINRHPAADDAQRRSCRRWNENLVRWVAEQDPDLVVLTSTVGGQGPTERQSAAYRRMWATLADKNTAVLAIRDTPRPGRDIPDCLATHGPTTRECDLPRGPLSDPDPAAARGGGDQVEFVDLTSYLCDRRSCPAVVGNVVVYSDDSHVTRSYSRSLAEPLIRLAPVLR